MYFIVCCVICFALGIFFASIFHEWYYRGILRELTESIVCVIQVLKRGDSTRSFTMLEQLEKLLRSWRRPIVRDE